MSSQGRESASQERTRENENTLTGNVVVSKQTGLTGVTNTMDTTTREVAANIGHAYGVLFLILLLILQIVSSAGMCILRHAVCDLL